MSAPRVSVIIPTHDRPALLREALESVFAARRDGFTVEVIVVDDSATPSAEPVAAAFPVRYLRTAGEQGASVARNTGLAAATGDYITFFDDDDLWLPNNMIPQLRVFAEHPACAVVYGQVILTDAQRTPYGEPQPQGATRVGISFEELLSHWPQLGTLLARRAVAVEIGGFDPTLRSEEEWDWLLRIARRYPIGFVAEATVLFRQRGLGDEDILWRRTPDTVKVFHRQTRQLAPLRRLAVQRILWSHLGWCAAHYMLSAQTYMALGRNADARRCVGYALRTSAPHATLFALRWGVALLRPKPAIQAQGDIAGNVS